MHRLRMTESSDLRELLLALRRLAAPLARRGAILYMQVDDAEQPSYLDVRLDGFGQPTESSRYMCRLISRFLCGKWRFRQMRRLIGECHPYLSGEEADYLAASSYGRCVRLEAAQAQRYREASRMEDIMADVFEQGLELHLDGLLRFRCSRWLHAMQRAAQERVDEYLVSREYEEFVGILRYFLDTTPSRGETVHVVCLGETVRGYDAKYEPLDVSAMETIARQTCEDDLHPQDVLMSALITRSPAQLIIHTYNVEESFVQTLVRVFGRRAQFCRDDPACDLLGGKLDTPRPSFYTTL
ncbi:MAG: sporulation protein YtxC [Firmicutes bacterium]|nr:sporulation protein YtxC [Bacillota bacterium]